MKKIIIIIPYFGIFPNTFKFWLLSVKFNESIDFLFFTDNKKIYNYDLPKNIKIYLFKNFKIFANIFKNKIGNWIKLKKPYKLCDYRPLYGYVFCDYVKHYDFWGYGDIDLIYGNIRFFITDKILNSHDVILKNGHLCLFRNCDSINNLYKVNIHNKHVCYPWVFMSNKNFCFDEQYMIYIFKSKKIKQYINLRIFIDLNPEKIYFEDCNSKKRIQELNFDNGVLQVNFFGKTMKQILYVHFQKRNISCSENIYKSNFKIIPNNILTSKNTYITKFNDDKISSYEKKIKKLYKISFFDKVFFHAYRWLLIIFKRI